ncbi:unnamed protein product [Blepharisma stoltei]|uniref:RING-type domain-containing protein n=1 Tax=Blepharisma stoltei TaxID=1481888 RepID=A0AAU9J2X4_9CILI|nr:unnamed protein product [Blepharisma stoltei]
MENFIEHFQCSICIEICSKAVESSCCASIFCEECTPSLQSCPNCRFKHPQFHPNKALRRIIGFLPWTCEFCEYRTENNNSEDHLKKCIKVPALCKYCSASFIRQNLLDHYIDAHQNEIIKDFDKKSENNTQTEDKRIEDQVNAKGRIAKIGRTGKFYCGGNLGASCVCCNGFCGPNSGCNCASCMTLDIQARRLPKGYLVNSKGMIAKIGTTGKIYCGCQVMKGVPHCDGWCGPNDGPNCGACQALERNWNGRYREITSRWA